MSYFCKLCWLEDYFVDNKPQNVFYPYVYCLRKKQEWTDFEKSYYIEYIEKYLMTAIAIINNRAEKIIEKLAAVCC